MSYNKDYKGGLIKVNVGLKGAKEGDDSVQHEFLLGGTLQEAIDMWGEEVVYSNFGCGAKAQLRNTIYRKINAGEKSISLDACRELLQTWAPEVQSFAEGEPRSRKDGTQSVKAAAKALTKMAPEDRAAALRAYLESIQKQLEDELAAANG